MSDEVISGEMKTVFLKLFGGDSESREVVYSFYEKSERLRAYLKGEHGTRYYAEIIEIAAKAGAPLEEVRERFIPLLDQHRFAEYTKQLVADAIKNGVFTRALQKLAEQKKTEVEELSRRHKEASAIIEEEKTKQDKLVSTIIFLSV